MFRYSTLIERWRLANAGRLIVRGFVMSKNKRQDVGAEKPAHKESDECKNTAYYVMAGKCLTSKRGFLSDGDEIKPGDLSGGKESLDAFVKSGHVGKS